MTNETKSMLDRVSFFACVVASVAFAGAALYLFVDAYRLSVANAATPLAAEGLAEYRSSQEKLLGNAGWADDRALGGEAGASKRSQKLGFRRTPIQQAKAKVLASITSGSWSPTRLTDEQLDVLDRLDMGTVTPEMIMASAKEPKSVESGMAIFKANCAACHGVQANGLVGPNLTDKWWIHGPQAKNIYKVIAQGVAAKGMPPWGHLGEENMKLVAAYVISIQNTNVEGKAPQGVDADGNPPPSSTGG